MSIRLFATTTLAFISATSVFAAERSVNLSVPGMFCVSCPFIVQAAIEEVDGVKSVKANSETREALVVFDDDVTTLEEIQLASLNAGYETTVIDGAS
jgi:mercuric ion binding protein